MVYHPHTDALKFVIPIIYSYIFLRTGVTFGRDFFFPICCLSLIMLVLLKHHVISLDKHISGSITYFS